MMIRFFATLTAIIAYAHSAALAQSGVALVADGGFTATPVQDCKSDLKYFNQLSGWQANWPAQWQQVVSGDAADLESAIEYWSAAPKALSETKNALETGIEQRQTAPHAVVIRVLQQVNDLLSALEEKSPTYFISGESGAAAKHWNTQLEQAIAPAIEDFRGFLEGVYLPASNRTPGLAAIEDGQTCFLKAATWWTTLTMTSEDIEKAGRRLLFQAKSELLETGADGLTLDMIMSRLRDKGLQRETTAQELIEISEAAITRAIASAPTMFKHSAADNIVVEEMPAHLQLSSPAGFYRPPQNDQPAAYVINSSRPSDRRLMAEVITFHETIPGHHYFFSYPRESESSEFNAGLLEGWAIYAEYVADEMGLYASDYDRQGMLAKHLWAASRLIVEPGLHVRGWSRDQAVAFMLENTVLSRQEIEIEVDRYLALPGQSLSYMLGADLILNERDCAISMLGEKFEIKEFHDAILAPGVRSLPTVQRELREWATSQIPDTGDLKKGSEHKCTSQN